MTGGASSSLSLNTAIFSVVALIIEALELLRDVLVEVVSGTRSTVVLGYVAENEAGNSSFGLTYA